MNGVNMTKYLKFFQASQKLKFVKRAGWTRFNQIENVEAVSDHCWMASLICLSLPQNLNINRDLCIKIALLHDLAEVIVGDLTPYDKVPKDLKKKMEDEAFKTLVECLDEDIKNELYEIFQQYETGNSIEAQIVRDVDKYEMMLQAFQYEQKYPGVDLSEFFKESSVIKTDPIKQLLEDLIQQRNKYLSSINK